ncbi:MAG TPA: Fic family protein [archaeon]|nr:Fic family protein [archaeon]
MFVSKRKIGKKTYFYLEDRVGQKRLTVSLGPKDQAGNRIADAFDLLVQKIVVENFQNSQKMFKSNVLSSVEQLVLERLKVDYELLKSFFPQSYVSFKEDEFVRYAQGSTSVEGNSLSLQEAALVLQKGTSIAGKKIEEIREIENMKLAVEASKNFKEVTEKGIKKINAAILKGFDEKTPGEYRIGPMFITASQVKPPSANKVRKEMAKLLNWLEKNKEKVHPIELASEFHARFEEIHPFNDGNGRTGREVLQVMLKNNSYPRAIVNLENRQSYIALLERVQVSKEHNKFSKFIYMCLEKRANEISQILKENKESVLKKIMKKS